MNIFRRRSGSPVNPNEQKNSVEINIAIDGQSYVTGMGVSGDDLNSKIEQHLARLQTFYDQQAAAGSGEKSKQLERLQQSIQSVRADQTRKIYDRCFLNIAEAYEAWAIIDGRAYNDGQTAWDYAWSVLNKEMLAAIMAVSEGQQKLLYNAYVELLFARGMHCLREMKSVDDGRAQNHYAELAANLFFTYLLEERKLNLSHWQINDAVKNIHLAKAYGNLSDHQLDDVAQQVAKKPNEESAADQIDVIVSQVKNYKLAETSRERLKQMIY